MKVLSTTLFLTFFCFGLLLATRRVAAELGIDTSLSTGRSLDKAERGSV